MFDHTTTPKKYSPQNRRVSGTYQDVCGYIVGTSGRGLSTPTDSLCPRIKSAGAGPGSRLPAVGTHENHNAQRTYH